MPCSKSFRRSGGAGGGGGSNDTFSMLLWTFGDYGLDAKKSFGLLGVSFGYIFLFFSWSLRLECIGSVLGYPEG